MENKLFRLPLSLRITTWVILGVWLTIAVFPLLWLLVMSFKLPLDAFDPNPFVVIFGPNTNNVAGGISVISVVLALVAAFLLLSAFANRDLLLERLGTTQSGTSPWVVVGVYLGFLVVAALCFVVVIPLLSRLFQVALGGVPLLNALVEPSRGLNHAALPGSLGRQRLLSAVFEHDVRHRGRGDHLFDHRHARRLRFGTHPHAPGRFGYLSPRSCFRALPHSTLVTGYLPSFIDWGLYGKRFAVVIVLVAINQPFTIWMLRSFFINIPSALDEAALVDGCNRLQAFWNVIMPIMWPGVITTGLFSFMLAYNDYLVSALLLDGETRTMVPAIIAYFNRETTLTDQLEAIAAAASITFPLFLLVLFFQRQIVSGLTTGAVKG